MPENTALGFLYSEGVINAYLSDVMEITYNEMMFCRNHRIEWDISVNRGKV